MKIESNLRYLKVYCLILSLCAIYACGNTKKVLKRQNIAYQYQQKAFENPLKTKFYQANSEQCQLFIEVSDNVIESNTNDWILTLKAYNSLDDKIPFDTLSAPIKFDQKVANIILPKSYNNNKNIFIETSLINLKNQKLYKNRYDVDTHDPSRYYLFKNKDTGIAILQAYTHANEEMILEYKGKELSDFKVISLPQNTYLPAPPYSEQTIEEKVIVEGITTTQKTPLKLKELGHYLIIPDQTNDSLTLSCRNKKFPKLASLNDLVQCLRYLTKKEEYQAMLNSPNLEASIDSFWLDKAGSTERAKVLIKEFYGRVQRANLFFTNHKMGWQTDQGLIYIIYGQPEIVYSREEEEIWKYVLPATAGSSNGYVVFHFKKEKNNYSQWNYQLYRDQDYEDSWHYVINEWRNGRISNISH